MRCVVMSFPEVYASSQQVLRELCLPSTVCCPYIVLMLTKCAYEDVMYVLYLYLYV